MFFGVFSHQFRLFKCLIFYAKQKPCKNKFARLFEDEFFGKISYFFSLMFSLIFFRIKAASA